jgi:uncharacterized RDD family membrane protein YckC
MAAKEKPLDLTIEVVSPENIEFDYEICGPVRRMLAFAIDWLLVGVGYVVLHFIGLLVILLFGLLGFVVDIEGLMEALAAFYQAAFIISLLVVFWLYGCFFEIWWNGQTPGKRLLGLRVMSYTGKPINAVQAVFRNFFRLVDMFPLVPVGAVLHLLFVFPATQVFMPSDPDDEYLQMLEQAYLIPMCLVAIVTMATNSRFQRIGDLFCGTMVVIENRSYEIGAYVPIDDPRTASLAEYVPRTFQFSRSLRLALTAYMEKRRSLSVPRRREIARHLAEPLLARFGLPMDTSYDLFLCALYYRAFAPDRGAEPPRPYAGFEGQPGGGMAAVGPAANFLSASPIRVGVEELPPAAEPLR